MEINLKNECWETLQNYAPDSIVMNHYDLAIETPIGDVETWKQFLKEPDVVDWLTEERKILQQTELAKLSTNIANSQSVGKAQLLTSMMKVNEANKTLNTDGPTFIYTYIPLNEQQMQAPNVRVEEKDIFLQTVDFKKGLAKYPKPEMPDE